MLRKTISVSFILALLILLTLIPVSVQSIENSLGILSPQKGMCYVTWDKDRFASKYSDRSLEKLVSLGVEYLAVCPTHYQQEYNSTDIKRTEKTPSKKSIKHVIEKAHLFGLKTMLKPHIDLIDKNDGTYWRADIRFHHEQNWTKWFSSYKKLILDYARLAEDQDIEILCIGTELSFASQKTEYWTDIISSIRKIYRGSLVYAANWDNFKNIRFWQKLDYVGIDAYFPLTYDRSTSYHEIKQGWQRWKRELSAWHSIVNKPILFTELGYASTPSAPENPWQGGTIGNVDLETQTKCYEAFFDTVWDEPWFAGVYWWKWDANVNAGGRNNRQFTPQNKPAQSVIEVKYKGYKKKRTYALIR